MHVGSRTHGRGTFCISHILVLHPSGRVKHTFKSDPVRFINSNKKYPRLNSLGTNLNSRYLAGPKGKTQDVFCNMPPATACPRKNIGATSAPNFANGSVGSAIRADQPQFTVHGELLLPKLKAEAGCRGEGKAKVKSV